MEDLEVNTSPVDISSEMTSSYLHYALSIFNRALPSVVDGLKTAQRRIILGLNDLNLRPGTPYKKVSRLEGHVLGFYHPSGGCAGTAINMGQATGFRYPLTDIHGNVGGSLQSGPSVGQSTSEDPPAAARYLEIRSTPITQRVFIDEIDRHACQWRDNYDGSTQEVSEIVPIIPMLLVNGAQGIASGYACHHVSYNLAEVVKATKYYIANPNVSSKRLFSFFSGPDLPNGARVLNDDQIFKAFETGQGALKLYGSWEFKQVEYGKRSKRDAIVITALATGSSEKFLEKVKEGLEAGKIENIADLSDLSSRDGISIQVILKAGADKNAVLSQLLAYTNLADTLNVNATALAGNLPTVFGVKDVIAEWYKTRVSALKKRYAAQITVLDKDIHILSGLLTILADIDRVVELIKKSTCRAEAKEKLKKSYKIDDVQAQAVLDMSLGRLVNTEQLEIKTKMETLKAKKLELEGIINDPTKMDQHLLVQLDEMKSFFDKPRSILITKDDVGVEKAKNNIVRVGRKAKLPTFKDKIKAEAKSLGIKRTELKEFLAKEVGGGDLKGKWEEFKKKHQLNRSLHTRAGRRDRREALEGLKAAAIAMGLDKRGQRGWNAFMASKPGLNEASVDEIEAELTLWMKKKYNV